MKTHQAGAKGRAHHGRSLLVGEPSIRRHERLRCFVFRKQVDRAEMNGIDRVKAMPTLFRLSLFWFRSE